MFHLRLFSVAIEVGLSAFVGQFITFTYSFFYENTLSTQFAYNIEWLPCPCFFITCILFCRRVMLGQDYRQTEFSYESGLQNTVLRQDVSFFDTQNSWFLHNFSNCIDQIFWFQYISIFYWWQGTYNSFFTLKSF